MKPLHNPDVDALFDAILSLKDRDECYAFFEDACTVKEILDISQRLKAAGLPIVDIHDLKRYLLTQGVPMRV